MSLDLHAVHIVKNKNIQITGEVSEYWSYLVKLRSIAFQISILHRIAVQKGYPCIFQTLMRKGCSSSRPHWVPILTAKNREIVSNLDGRTLDVVIHRGPRDLTTKGLLKIQDDSGCPPGKEKRKTVEPL